MKQGFGNVNGSTGGAISPARRQEVLRSCRKQESVNERKYGNSQTTGQPVVTLILIFTLFSLSSIVFSCSDDLPISQLPLLRVTCVRRRDLRKVKAPMAIFASDDEALV